MNINDTASLSFLDKCLQEILKQHPKDLHHLQFIVPSQRVGKHLLHSLVEQKKTMFFSPKIQTIPRLLTDLSQLTIEKNHLKLLLFLYEIHCKIEAEKSYTLDQFLPFGELLLGDFNLIDQYGIDIKALFRDLKNYQELEGFLDSEWSFATASGQGEERPVWSFGQQEFSNFWDKLPHYYLKFQEKQEKEALFTQGLLTRKVADNISEYVQAIDAGQHFFFIGLNALSVSEQKIIHYLEKIGKATSFYNIDEYFLDQEAGSFFKKNKNNQTYSFVENLIQTETKHIEIIASTTQVQQAVEVGKILENIQFLPGKKAVLLGQESLVPLLLHYLPETVEVNISTGLPLQVSRAYTLVLKIFEINPYKDLS